MFKRFFSWLGSLFERPSGYPLIPICGDDPYSDMVMAAVIAKCWNSGDTVFAQVDDDGNIRFDDGEVLTPEEVVNQVI